MKIIAYVPNAAIKEIHCQAVFGKKSIFKVFPFLLATLPEKESVLAVNQKPIGGKFLRSQRTEETWR